MIAADTSTWIAFLQGESGDDVETLDQSLRNHQVLMAPPVLAELLSDPKLLPEVSELLSGVPLIEILPRFWIRAGLLRASALRRRRKARLGDALIAQSCLDADIPLVTRDHDFRAFAEAAALQIVFDGKA